ncbi:TetR/AcrR family transcriptional regulator C-terminal domain-containing protein [Streptomyces lichenis]|uniref:TetR/AcrR family transcriptional regulator n=1 Tax=Streptomyces lichenis TaxID=2306967 RepID=A0ABT0ICZ9_9ACTN|nr:TetR/AcrR family transcriptional regulator C-terminal domain-containing protein [Streptomyces lichenis]MCK8679205.1 TetR/AcrR family transcriptional regulator [Streptomyces lichenis]
MSSGESGKDPAPATSGSGDISRSLELLWGLGEPPNRGPKRGLTLEQITTAAVAVADAEGLAAVSMRRLSTDLGVGTMSLYRYVPGKAELLDLMLDHVQGLVIAGPGEPPADWREAVRRLGRVELRMYRERPWLLKVNQARTALGPNTMRSMELALAGLRGMGLTDPETIGVIVAVHNYTAGVARMELDTAEAAQQTGVSDEEFWTQQGPFLDRAMRSGEFPLTAALSDDTFSADFDHFEFGLNALVTGFEAVVAERRRLPEGSEVPEDSEGS